MASIYAPPPIYIGGRRPIAPGKKPHLAALIPELAFPRSLIIQQIRRMILGEENLIILGSPGVGKSTIVEKMLEESRLEFDNRRDYSETSERILSDDQFSLVNSASHRAKIIQQIKAGKQFIFISPPYYEPDYVKFASECAAGRRPRVIILPPADYAEFSNAFRLKHSLSEDSLSELYEISGGNYRITEHILSKSISGYRSPADQIYSNFRMNFAVLSLKSRLAAGNFSISNLWELENTLGRLDSLLRLLKYGILKVEGNYLHFRGTLVREAFSANH